MLTHTQRDTLETLIDADHLAGVLEGLAEICYGKAAHVETTWQDRPLSREWKRAARLLDHAVLRLTATTKVPGIGV